MDDEEPRDELQIIAVKKRLRSIKAEIEEIQDEIDTYENDCECETFCDCAPAWLRDDYEKLTNEQEELDDLLLELTMTAKEIEDLYALRRERHMLNQRYGKDAPESIADWWAR